MSESQIFMIKIVDIYYAKMEWVFFPKYTRLNFWFKWLE